ncbi:MAG: Nudix family hydrolase [Methylococcaceae bacterium]|nr:Nudix family hydrolase [Methylococcaceae bacterium]
MNSQQVAVGVIKNPSGQTLISLRNEKLHQGGLWEFPGGKIEASETVDQALARELKEELDIDVRAAVPLITINHQYPELAVQLIVYSVEQFSGEVKSCEGQPFLWVNPDDLINYAFPKANKPIIAAARLPDSYAILDDADPSRLSSNLKKMLDNGIKLIQARFKHLPSAQIKAFIQEAYPLVQAHNACLLMNSGSADWEQFEVDGVHLTSRDLMSTDKRPANMEWVAASCHNLEELWHAEQIGVDFAVLAPVLPTPTHPDAESLGWARFAELVAHVNLPVYALGGLSKSDVVVAREAGAQGIAGIRAFL